MRKCHSLGRSFYRELLNMAYAHGSLKFLSTFSYKYIHLLGLKIKRNSLKNTQPMYMVFVRLYFNEKSATESRSSRSRLSSKSAGISRKMQKRKYDGETSEGVPCSIAYSSLAVRSHLAVKIVAPRLPDSQTP